MLKAALSDTSGLCCLQLNTLNFGAKNAGKIAHCHYIHGPLCSFSNYSLEHKMPGPFQYGWDHMGMVPAIPVYIYRLCTVYTTGQIKPSPSALVMAARDGNYSLRSLCKMAALQVFTVNINFSEFLVQILATLGYSYHFFSKFFFLIFCQNQSCTYRVPDK